jgi:asparagine synthase (glutamine-hydrolysing)
MSRVPARIKLPRLRKKHVMRRAMSELLPLEILNKKKVGLEIPYSRWLKHELNDQLMTYCGPARMADIGLFRPEAVTQLIQQHLAGQRDNGRALWGLLNFMIWHESYIN